MEAADILRKPYARQVVPQADGLFKAEILEFPGCFAVGDTAIEALATLEEVAIDWVVAAQEQEQEIPEPTESAGYSGKLVVRMSKTLHKKATQFALRDGVSLNQFLVNCIAEHVGMLARPALAYLQPMQIATNISIQLPGRYPLVTQSSALGLPIQGAATSFGSALSVHMRHRGDHA